MDPVYHSSGTSQEFRRNEIAHSFEVLDRLIALWRLHNDSNWVTGVSNQQHQDLDLLCLLDNFEKNQCTNARDRLYALYLQTDSPMKPAVINPCSDTCQNQPYFCLRANIYEDSQGQTCCNLLNTGVWQKHELIVNYDVPSILFTSISLSRQCVLWALRECWTQLL